MTRRTRSARRAPAFLVRGLAVAGVVAALVGMADLLLSSCGTLPTPGGVRVDRGVEADTAYDGPDIRRLPVPPVPGSPPEKIVQDFLEAAAGQEADPVVAREFLSPDASWNPYGGAIVYDPDSSGSARFVQARELVTMSVHQTGVIDPLGGYRSMSATTVLGFGVTRVDGEWRLRSIPRGVSLVLSQTDVARDYRAVTVYRLARTRDALVADPVELPVTSAAIAGAIVRSVLAGPAQWLAAATRTGLPAGTHLNDSVTVISDAVTVDLSREATTLDDRGRALFLAELAASLRPLPAVERIRLLVEGRRVLPGDGTVSIQSAATLEPDAPSGRGAVVVQDGLLARDATFTTRPTFPSLAPVPGSTAGARDFSDPALAGDGGLAALRLSSAGATLVVAAPGRLPVARLGPADLTAPTWSDGLGFMVGMRGPTPRLAVVRPDGATVDARTATLPTLGQRLDTIRVSPDGARLLAVVDEGGGQSVYLGRIDSSAARPAVDGWTRLGLPSGVTAVADVAWFDSLDVAILTDRGGAPAVWRLPLTASDATQITPGRVPPGVSGIAAAPGAPLLACDGERVWALEGGGWRPAGTGSDASYVR
jgi:Lipoprotein LpqB beta-propeller domain/Sporulation and spore germination